VNNRPQTNGRLPNGDGAAPQAGQPAPTQQDNDDHQHGPDKGRAAAAATASRHCRADRSPRPVTTRRAHRRGHRPALARTHPPAASGTAVLARCLRLGLGLCKGYPLATRAVFLQEAESAAVRSNWTEKKRKTGAKPHCRTFKAQPKRPSG
jgi:hypothetical protein